MIINGELEIPRYRVDSYDCFKVHTHYFGDSISEAKASINFVFNQLIQTNYQYPTKLIIFDNYENKEIEVKYYPDEMV